MDADILEELYRNYSGKAYLYLLSLGARQETAEDLVADAFVTAYLTLPDDVPSFLYWLLKVCKNRYTDQLRREKHLTGPDALDTLTAPDTPESRYLKTEESKALWKAIGELSPRDRELLTAHYFGGIPLQDIARLMNRSYPAVRQRLSRLRFALRKRMEEQGYGL